MESREAGTGTGMDRRPRVVDVSSPPTGFKWQAREKWRCPAQFVWPEQEADVRAEVDAGGRLSGREGRGLDALKSSCAGIDVRNPRTADRGTLTGVAKRERARVGDWATTADQWTAS